PSLAAQPFAVQQAGSGELSAGTCLPELVDRRTVEYFRSIAVAEQGARARLVSASCSGASDASPGWPLREAASTSSTSAHVQNTSSCGYSQAFRAARRPPDRIVPVRCISPPWSTASASARSPPPRHNLTHDGIDQRCPARRAVGWEAVRADPGTDRNADPRSPLD